MTENSGELVFKGRNVCLGYASEWGHLFHDDINSGILYTGDKGSLDSDGFIYITGRVGRDIKISGTRFSLDTIESQLEKEEIRAYALSLEDRIGIVYSQIGDYDKIMNLLLNDFNLSQRNLAFRHLENIPLLENGKINYRLLQEFFL